MAMVREQFLGGNGETDVVDATGAGVGVHSTLRHHCPRVTLFLLIARAVAQTPVTRQLTASPATLGDIHGAPPCGAPV